MNGELSPYLLSGLLLVVASCDRGLIRGWHCMSNPIVDCDRGFIRGWHCMSYTIVDCVCEI